MNINIKDEIIIARKCAFRDNKCICIIILRNYTVITNTMLMQKIIFAWEQIFVGNYLITGNLRIYIITLETRLHRAWKKTITEAIVFVQLRVGFYL